MRVIYATGGGSRLPCTQRQLAPAKIGIIMQACGCFRDQTLSEVSRYGLSLLLGLSLSKEEQDDVVLEVPRRPVPVGVIDIPIVNVTVHHAATHVYKRPPEKLVEEQIHSSANERVLAMFSSKTAAKRMIIIWAVDARVWGS